MLSGHVLKYGLLFGLQGIHLFLGALFFGGWGLLCLWPALSLLHVALAYLLKRPSLLGKMPSGHIQPIHKVLLFPFHCFVLGVWHVLIRLQREPAYHTIHPHLLVGRRLLPGELTHPVDLIVDLTSEFSQPPQVNQHTRYVSIPTLDATDVNLAPLLDVLTHVIATHQSVYIHCAQGHGRTAFAAALLLGMQHRASSPRQALELLQSQRPAMGLNSSQMKALSSAWSQLSL